MRWMVLDDSAPLQVTHKWIEHRHPHFIQHHHQKQLAVAVLSELLVTNPLRFRILFHFLPAVHQILQQYNHHQLHRQLLERDGIALCTRI